METKHLDTEISQCSKTVYFILIKTTLTKYVVYSIALIMRMVKTSGPLRKIKRKERKRERKYDFSNQKLKANSFNVKFCFCL